MNIDYIDSVPGHSDELEIGFSDDQARPVFKIVLTKDEAWDLAESIRNKISFAAQLRDKKKTT